MDFRNKLVPGKPFQPSVMIVGKARAYLNGVHIRNSALRVVF
jgi:hypothetical protein